MRPDRMNPRFASFIVPFNLQVVHTPESVRIDKWLWAVRLYKSRSLASGACNAGHVKIGGANVKPSRDVHADDVITLLAGRVHRTVRVIALLDQRVGAKLVSQFLGDLTPPEEYARARDEAARVHFPKGLGRPTKKQRRQLMGAMNHCNEAHPADQ